MTEAVMVERGRQEEVALHVLVLSISLPQALKLMALSGSILGTPRPTCTVGALLKPTLPC